MQRSHTLTNDGIFYILNYTITYIVVFFVFYHFLYVFMFNHSYYVQ